MLLTKTVHGKLLSSSVKHQKFPRKIWKILEDWPSYKTQCTAVSPVVGNGTLPLPHPQASLVPGGGGTIAKGEGVGKSRFWRGDIHCETLYIRVYVLYGPSLAALLVSEYFPYGVCYTDKKKKKKVVLIYKVILTGERLQRLMASSYVTKYVCIS